MPRRALPAGPVPGARRAPGVEVLVVVGATGGVGASTLAALLAARRARAGTRTALVDLDHGGGGIEVLLGIEHLPGARWADLAAVRGALSPDDLDGVLPRWQGVEVLGSDRRGGAPGTAARDAVTEAVLARYGSVVVDLPARSVLTDVGGATRPAGGLLDVRSDLLLLAGQDVLGVAGALCVRAAVPDGPVQLVLRRRRAATVAPLEAAHLLDLPILGLVPHDRRLADAVEHGLGPVVGRWSRTARAVAAIAEGAGDG